MKASRVSKSKPAIKTNTWSKYHIKHYRVLHFSKGTLLLESNRFTKAQDKSSAQWRPFKFQQVSPLVQRWHQRPNKHSFVRLPLSSPLLLRMALLFWLADYFLLLSLSPGENEKPSHSPAMPPYCAVTLLLCVVAMVWWQLGFYGRSWVSYLELKEFWLNLINLSKLCISACIY